MDSLSGSSHKGEMNTNALKIYDLIRSGKAGFYEQSRGLIAVSGKEAVAFLDGMISNDMKTLEDGQQMLAAFPNAQGRVIAVVRVRREADRFLFETETATRDKVFQNLYRFTFAGDFFVDDLSAENTYFEIFGPKEDVYHPGVGDRFTGAVVFELAYGAGYFIPNVMAEEFLRFLTDDNGCLVIPDEVYETLRIENGIPRYGVDMDENTIVPELGLDGLISYNKGCYIGQEIIARIHFRGHVAKRMAGLVLDGAVPSAAGGDLTTAEGKNGGRITSTTYSPKLEKNIALGFVRFDYLEDGTELISTSGAARVTTLPFL